MSEGIGAAPSGVFVRMPISRAESIGADVNIGGPPFVTRITGYNNAITLDPGNASHGGLKKIYNDSGSTVTINSNINVQGAATDTITLAAAAGSFVLLMYLNSPDTSERYRDMDFIGLTLS